MTDHRMRRIAKFVREGDFAAEVEIDLVYTDDGWSPTMSMDDGRKLETVGLALRRGDIAEAAKYGRVFKLTPVS